ncbi:hypothetical protein [Nitrosopumilus sp. S4]
MVNKANPEKTLSIKTKLGLIAIMFVIINLIFYVVFDSTDQPTQSEKSIELDNTVQTRDEITIENTEDMKISINP